MQQSKKTAYGGIAAALTAVMLIVTGYTSYGCYAAAALGGIILLCFSYRIGRRYALTSYAAAAIVSLLLCSDKSGSMLFLTFAGYYPVVRNKLNEIKPAVWKIVLKCLVIFSGGALYTVTFFLQPVFLNFCQEITTL